MLVAGRVLMFVAMRVVVRMFDGLRAPREDEVSMRCGVGVAVNMAAVPVREFSHAARVPSQGGLD
jgi:hypothetical protein